MSEPTRADINNMCEVIRRVGLMKTLLTVSAAIKVIADGQRASYGQNSGTAKQFDQCAEIVISAAAKKTIQEAPTL